MARPVRSDYDNPGQFAQALREYEAANPTTPVAPTELPEYKDLAYQAAGYSGDTKTSDYIKALASGSLGGEADTKNALNILIQQGQARNLAERGNVEFYPGYDPGGRPEDTSVSDTPAGFVADTGAEEILRAGLAQYGLESLYPALWKKYTSKSISLEDPAGFIYALREEPEYKARFAGNEKRKSLGFKELQPSTYLALEKSYKDILSANGLPQGFYDSNDDFQQLIGGDVSVNELNNRLKDAYSVVRDATPEVKAKLSAMYGITNGDILAYIIDAEKARPLMAPDYKRQAQAALIAESAQRNAGLNLGKDLAESFVRQGVTEQQAETAFFNAGTQQGLYTSMAGEEALTDEEKAGAALGTNVSAVKKVSQRQSLRKSAFQGGGSFTKTAGAYGTSGATESGLSVAQ
jgi:hypothetical protein